LLAAWAWRFGGAASTNNAAELAALWAGLQQLQGLGLRQEQQGLGVLVLGDSQLIVSFCNRQYKPSKKFFNTVADIRTLARKWPVPMKFQHVYREQNVLADWLANVAKHLTTSTDLTPHLSQHHSSLTFISSPPWPAKEAPEQL
jgi:ribonuclease HI